MTDEKNIEIDSLKQQNYQTKRVVSEDLENILYEPLNALDHGFIRIIDYMGTDSSITQAARVSYGKGTKSVQNDKMLIRYLMKHYHTSPFEMCEIKLHVKCPIFVARQWVRHRTSNVNEYSGRYSLMSKEFYVPQSEHIKEQSKNNKQGRGETLDENIANLAKDKIDNISNNAFNVYDELLSLEGKDEGDKGVARELSRIILPLNTYTEFYWKIDLHNLLHFTNLRAHPHSQYEIRVYAEIILDIIKKWVPITYQAFLDYKKDAFTLSKEAFAVVNDKLKGETIKKQNYSLSKREWKEIEDMFGIVVDSE